MSAKTGSKNAPTNRGQAIAYYYNDKLVVPIQYFSSVGNYISASYKDTREIVVDLCNKPVRWSLLRKEKRSA